MDLFTIPRQMARLQYMTARLPFTVFDKYVVAPYWNDQALPRLGYESFLESMDRVAGWLLADGDISPHPDKPDKRRLVKYDREEADHLDQPDERRLVKYDPAEADHLDQLAESERAAHRSS
jgi:hypothetical protein